MIARSLTVDQIRKHPAVVHAGIWKGRINIDLRGTTKFRAGKSLFKGEQTSKVNLDGDVLLVERGVGDTSPEWEANLESLVRSLSGLGVEIRFRSGR